MASAVPKPHLDDEHDADLEMYIIAPEEGRRMFDEAAREWVGISGAEFIRRWEAGEFAEIPDDEAIRIMSNSC